MPAPTPAAPGEPAPAGPDLNQLMNIFATKQAPDNTIKRIYDLEQMMNAL